MRISSISNSNSLTKYNRMNPPDKSSGGEFCSYFAVIPRQILRLYGFPSQSCSRRQPPASLRSSPKVRHRRRTGRISRRCHIGIVVDLIQSGAGKMFFYNIVVYRAGGDTCSFTVEIRKSKPPRNGALPLLPRQQCQQYPSGYQQSLVPISERTDVISYTPGVQKHPYM
mgnify:CR=1 FL=1